MYVCSNLLAMHISVMLKWSTSQDWHTLIGSGTQGRTGKAGLSFRHQEPAPQDKISSHLEIL